VLAAANRGILYVDEVNLLDDHVVDLFSILRRWALMLSSAKAFVSTSRAICFGRTMNPEEGELRPQLLDRFGLSVEIKGIADADARVEILNVA